MYRNIRYILDQEHPLQPLAGNEGLFSYSLEVHRHRGLGNVGILKGFPRSVGRVGSQLYGFPCFPHSVISMAVFVGSLGLLFFNVCGGTDPKVMSAIATFRE